VEADHEPEESGVQAEETRVQEAAGLEGVRDDRGRGGQDERVERWIVGERLALDVEPLAGPDAPPRLQVDDGVGTDPRSEAERAIQEDGGPQAGRRGEQDQAGQRP
jgi:hypothetical protein